MVDHVRMESTATLVRVWRGTVEITVKRVSFELRHSHKIYHPHKSIAQFLNRKNTDYCLRISRI